MKVLMFSIDKTILDKNSVSAGRMAGYGSICEELHIVVLGAGEKRNNLNSNVFIYSAGEGRFASIFGAIRIGKALLSKKDNWIITTQDPFETGFVGWYLSKKLKTPLEIQIHGDFYGNKYWRRENFLNFFRFYLGKFILKRANSVRAVSKRIKNTISNDNVYILPIFSDVGVVAGNPNFLKDKFPGAYPIILAVGNLVPVKNHKQLIEVFADIKKEFSNAKLVIVGDGPLEKDLRFKILDLGLESDVWLAGHKKNLADFYASADIFVHPSLYEGWGRAVIEAAYFGLPIIMNDVGLASEVIKNEESGLIVLVNDKNAMKDAVIKLLNDGDLKNKISVGARSAALRLSNYGEYLNDMRNNWESIIKK